MTVAIEPNPSPDPPALAPGIKTLIMIIAQLSIVGLGLSLFVAAILSLFVIVAGA